MERRERLRRLMASDDRVQEKLARHVEETIMEEVVLQPKEKFYTEGPPELKAARMQVRREGLGKPYVLDCLFYMCAASTHALVLTLYCRLPSLA